MILDVPGNVGRHSGARVSYDHDVATHRLERIHSVEDALAFLSRRGVDVEIENVGAEPLAGKVKRRACARARLEEQVGHCASGERIATRRQVALGRQKPFGRVQ